MINHHPTSDILMEHSAGTLTWAFSLGVTAHLQMCTQCRQKIRQLNDVGGAVLESGTSELPSAAAFQRLMGKIEQASEEITNPTRAVGEAIDNHPPKKSSSVKTSHSLPSDLPKVIRKLLPEDKPLAWERIFPSMRVARLVHGKHRENVSLVRIASGGRITEHNHLGLELTLVLSGSFSDTHGLYSAGDFLLQEAGEVHRPTATQDQPCWCLSITQAPVVPTSLGGWLASRFPLKRRLAIAD